MFCRSMGVIVGLALLASPARATDCNQNGIDDSQELTCGYAFSAKSNITPPGLAIPDYSLTGVSHTIQATEAVDMCKLRLRLHIVHGRVGQLVVRLRHDDGINPLTEIVLIDLMGNPTPHNSGGECGAGLDLVLSDEATTSIELSDHTVCDNCGIYWLL